jgi:16S rRNA (guanine(966)-N(2))-methyltransferase RsmD
MRITGGEHRSRTLETPRGNATRPTSDRVREALFAILGGERDFVGANVLDLYAGTGALAFEALSRGAAHATLVESARPALQAIEANAKALGVAPRIHLVPLTIERALAALRRSRGFDLIFADPPYELVKTGAAPRAIAGILAGGVLADDGRMVLEHGKGEAAPEIAGVRLRESRRYGDTVISFYERSTTARV